MGLSIWHLLVVLAIVLIIFGTRKLRDFGGDIGTAIKNFKSAVNEEGSAGKKGDSKKVVPLQEKKPRVIEGKTAPARKKKKTS